MLWREQDQVPLSPKLFAILQYLAERPEQTVTKDELLRAVWPDTAVSEQGLKSYIRRLRKVLDDSPRQPRFIETVHGSGYRWIASGAGTEKVQSSGFNVQGEVVEAQHSKPTPHLQPPIPILVGREAELGQLHDRLALATGGERQLVFVTGEPGIGKTTLVDAFCHDLTAEQGCLILRGQSVEQYGSGEAYLPILSALERACRTPEGGGLTALLNQQAPMWLLQMPVLLSPAEREALQLSTAGASPQRMLREMAVFLEGLGQKQPVVLVLEDLHWSDTATLSLLSFLAQRQETARLFVIGTYRPVEALTQEHALIGVQQELIGKGLCAELSVPLLTRSDVEDYLVRTISPGNIFTALRTRAARTVGWQSALFDRHA